MIGLLLLPLALAQAAPPAPAASPSAPAASPPAPAASPDAAAPKVPRFALTPIGACGCSLYAPPGLTVGPPGKSEDGADVWMGESVIDGWHYGVVAVRFAEPFTDATPEQLEELLVAYLEFLRSQLGIVSSAGVGRGHTHGENAAARGVIDYWHDADGDDFAVKGWIDRSRIGILYVAGKGSYPWFSAQQMFLDGFRFR